MAVATVVAACAPAAAAPAGDALQRADLRRLTDAEERWTRRQLERAPFDLRRLVRLAAPHLKLRRGHRSEPGRGTWSFALHGDGLLRITVSLAPVIARSGETGRHVLMHELGHAIEIATFGDADRERLDGLLRESPHWRDCFEMADGACAPPREVVAEQLAFWAAGDRSVRTGYAVPPLLSRAAMSRFMATVGYAAGAYLHH